MREFPDQFESGPSKAVNKLNQLLNASRENYVIAGAGIVLRETPNGVYVTLCDAILNYFGLNGQAPNTPYGEGGGNGGLGPGGGTPQQPEEADPVQDPEKNPNNYPYDPRPKYPPYTPIDPDEIPSPEIPTIIDAESVDVPFTWLVDGIAISDSSALFDNNRILAPADGSAASGYVKSGVGEDVEFSISYRNYYYVGNTQVRPAYNLSVEGEPPEGFVVSLENAGNDPTSFQTATLRFTGKATTEYSTKISVVATPADIASAGVANAAGYTFEINLTVKNGAIEIVAVNLPTTITLGQPWQGTVYFTGGYPDYTFSTDLYGVADYYATVDSSIGNGFIIRGNGGSGLEAGLTNPPPYVYMLPIYIGPNDPPNPTLEAQWKARQLAMLFYDDVFGSNGVYGVLKSTPITVSGTITITDSMGTSASVPVSITYKKQ